MASFAEYAKAQAQKEQNRFFGEGNVRKVSNQYFKFNHVLDVDTVIINTNNVRIIKDNPVLVVGACEAVYLKPWNVLKAHNFQELGDNFYLVKLSRQFFKTYTFKNQIDKNLCFDEVQDFDALSAIAKKQDEENMKVALGFMYE